MEVYFWVCQEIHYNTQFSVVPRSRTICSLLRDSSFYESEQPLLSLWLLLNIGSCQSVKSLITFKVFLHQIQKSSCFAEVEKCFKNQISDWRVWRDWRLYNCYKWRKSTSFKDKFIFCPKKGVSYGNFWINNWNTIIC